MIYTYCFHNSRFSGMGFLPLRNARRHIYDSAKPSCACMCVREAGTFRFVLAHACLWRRQMWTSDVLLYRFLLHNLRQGLTLNLGLTVPAKLAGH